MTAVATPPKAAPSNGSPAGELRRIPLGELHESSHNPRQRYDEAALKELAASLLQTGQLTPIIVRSRKSGGYEIAAGHRRYRAATLAVKQQPDGAKYRGVDALEAKVVELDDRAFIEVLNVENLQRDDLHPLEEATGYGFVASGRGQGEVFRVCINKQKCKVHWPEHVKRAEAAKKRAKKGTTATSSGSDEKRQNAEAAAERKRTLEEQHTHRVEDVTLRLIQERAPQWALGVVALAKQIKLPAEFASWMARDRMLEPDLENDIDFGDAGPRARHVFEAMRPKLGGGWSKRGLPETAAAQPVAMALLFWLNNSLTSVEAALERDAEKIVVAEEKAAAAKAKAEKKPAKKKAKK